MITMKCKLATLRLCILLCIVAGVQSAPTDGEKPNTSTSTASVDTTGANVNITKETQPPALANDRQPTPVIHPSDSNGMLESKSISTDQLKVNSNLTSKPSLSTTINPSSITNQVVNHDIQEENTLSDQKKIVIESRAGNNTVEVSSSPPNLFIKQDEKNPVPSKTQEETLAPEVSKIETQLQIQSKDAMPKEPQPKTTQTINQPQNEKLLQQTELPTMPNSPQTQAAALPAPEEDNSEKVNQPQNREDASVIQTNSNETPVLQQKQESSSVVEVKDDIPVNPPTTQEGSSGGEVDDKKISAATKIEDNTRLSEVEDKKMSPAGTTQGGSTVSKMEDVLGDGLIDFPKQRPSSETTMDDSTSDPMYEEYDSRTNPFLTPDDEDGYQANQNVNQSPDAVYNNPSLDQREPDVQDNGPSYEIGIKNDFSKVNGQSEQHLPQFTDDVDSHFFAYFLTIMVTSIIFYLVFHNKQKIIALIIEGRAPGGNRPRRSSSRGNYHKLDNNLEEAITATKGNNGC